MAKRKSNLSSSLEAPTGGSAPLVSPQLAFDASSGVAALPDSLLHDILDSCALVVFVKDIEGRYLLANQHFKRLFCGGRDDIHNWCDEDLFGVEVAERLHENDLSVFQQGQPLELEEEVPHADGLHTYISVKYPLFDDQGRVYAVCGIATDITDRKRAEALLSDSELRYRMLADQSSDLIARHAPSGDCLYISPACEPLLGYTPEELMGVSPYALMHPDDVEPTQRQHLALLTTDLNRVVISMRMRHKNGEYQWFETTVDAVRNRETNAVQEFIAVSRNVSERKRAEVAMRHAMRMASIGTLAAGIAHEINNPIGAAWTSAEAALAIKDDPESGELLEECLQNVIQSVRRCGEIVRNVLKFSRHEVLEKKPADLNGIVRTACDACLVYATGRGTTFDLKLAEELPAVKLNSLEMEQVVINLIRNAIESGSGVLVQIGTERAGDKVRLQVTDNGQGIGDKEREHIFEPFFTLRAGQGGTGLGLSIVFGIVQEHEGTIDFQSQLGQGTTVTVELPVAAPETSPPLST